MLHLRKISNFSKLTFQYTPILSLYPNIVYITLISIRFIESILLWINMYKLLVIDKIQTGDTELTKASRVQNCVHSNSFINDDIFVEKSQKSQSVHTFKPAKYLFTDTWVHYEDLILHFCKVSKPLEFITFQLVIHCF